MLICNGREMRQIPLGIINREIIESRLRPRTFGFGRLLQIDYCNQVLQ